MNDETEKDDPLSGFPVSVEIPVAWTDMDAYQHVNNVVYFRWFEAARIAYAERIGLHAFKVRTGIGPILGSTSCRYRLPLTYPDTVRVGTRVTAVDEDRFTMQYVIVSRTHGKVAAEGDGVIVMYDYEAGRKIAIPDEIRRRIEMVERS